MKTHSIGIDFGTSKTLVSRINPETGRPEALRLGRECDMIPSSVYIDKGGGVYFGDDADDMLEDITGVYLRGFKMQLGSDMPVHGYLDSKGEFKLITAKDLVKEYLFYIRWRVETEFYQDAKVTKAVITRPVNFTPSQISQLRQAAIAAGFEQVEFTTEPEAAGLAYCRLNAATSFADSALVVDWGGGTLDFALVTRQGNSVSTHGHLTDGDMTMGGEKFDERLWRYVEKIAAEKGVTKLNHVTQMPKVRRCKEQLSSRQNVALHMSYELGACPAIPLRRQEFERLIEDDIDKAVQKLQALIKRIPIEHKPEMLLLVGGSSQIPLIKEKMEAACNLPAYQWNLAREAVALGAALWLLKDYNIKPCRVCGADLILLGQSQLTCSHCNSTYHVSQAGQLLYGYSIINCGHCGHCGHNSRLNYPNQSSCNHCAAEFSWNKEQKKMGLEVWRDPFLMSGLRNSAFHA